jgi:hypothetical protein
MTIAEMRAALEESLRHDPPASRRLIRDLLVVIPIDAEIITTNALAAAIQHIETPVGAIYPPIDPFIKRAAAIIAVVRAPSAREKPVMVDPGQGWGISVVREAEPLSRSSAKRSQR